MPSLDQIIDLEISRETKSVSQKGFGTPLVLGLHTRFAERIRYYSSVEEMEDDGFLSSDAEHKAATAIFSQDQTPERIGVGRRTAAVAQVVTFTPTVLNLTEYTVTINGTLHSFTSDSDATDAEIVAGLIAAINGGAQAGKVTASGTTTLIVTSDAAGEAFTYANSSNLAAVLTTPNNGVIEDIAAVTAEDDDWYMLMLTSRTDLDIRLAASRIETVRKMFIACSDSADVKNGVGGNIAAVLQGLGYERTAYLWSADQANYPEGAWMGLCLPFIVGSETWKFKSLSGITADNLSTSEQNNIKSANGNTYETFAGVSITAEGKVASGEFIDIIRGVDWLHARIQETIFQTLINVPKVPYTDAGVAVIENDIRARLTEGVRVGLLAADPEFTVSVPKVADVSTADKINRLLPDVTFDATLAGAIHKVQIRGRVSV